MSNNIRVVKRNNITTPLLLAVVVILAVALVYVGTSGTKEKPAQADTSEQQLAAANMALLEQVRTSQGTGSTAPVTPIDPAVLEALMAGYLNRNDVEANGTNNAEGTEEPNPSTPSKTIRITYVAPNGDPAELNIQDRGSSLLNIRDTAIQVSSLNYLEAYGAAETGTDRHDLVNLIYPDFYGVVINRILPNAPISGLQETQGVSLSAWLATATNLEEVMTPENYVARKVFIPPGYRETDAFKAGTLFYSPQDAEKWAQSIVDAEEQLVGGELQGELGIEITMRVSLCHFTIFDKKTAGELGNGPKAFQERAMNMLSAIGSLGKQQAFDTATALTEAEKLAWEALKSSENIQQAYATGRASWQPGGASYDSEVNRALLMGFTYVSVNVEVTPAENGTPVECASTIFGREDTPLIIPGR